MKSCRLPPGSLGLELEASHRSTLGKQQGIKIKKWRSDLFSLSAVPPKSVLYRIDGVDIRNMAFVEAVNLLKTSEIREIEYTVPDEAEDISKEKEQDKVFSATLKFQELDKENSPPNVSISMSTSPTAGKDFWTEQKMDRKGRSPLKTRSPLRFKGVYTSPRMRQAAHRANNNKQVDGEDWVCIPLAEQFENIGSPQSEKPTPPAEPLPEEDEEENLVVELKKQELVDVAINTSDIVERVTPLKGKIRELEANVAGKREQIDVLGGTLKELKSGSRNSDGKIALLKFQLSKTIKEKSGKGDMISKGAVTGEAVQEAVSSPSVLAHLKMCRAIQAVKSAGLQEKGTGTDVLPGVDASVGPDVMDNYTLSDSAPLESPKSEQAQVNISSGTLHGSTIVEEPIDVGVQCQVDFVDAEEGRREAVNISSGTLHGSTIAEEPVDVGVQCQVDFVDAMVGDDTAPVSVSDLSPTRESVATQSTLDIAVDGGGREGIHRRLKEQDRYIGLLTQQMHAYVDCHIEALRSAASHSPTRSKIERVAHPDATSMMPNPQQSYSEVLESIPLSQVPTQEPSAVIQDKENEAEVEADVVVEEGFVGTGGAGEVAVKNAFKAWQLTKDTPTTVGLSPASFRAHLSHMRSEIQVTRGEINSWQKKFREMREDCDQEPTYFRL